MRYWGGREIKISQWTVGCESNDDFIIDGCRGNAAVFRISMMQAIFFFFMTFGSWWSPDFHLTGCGGKIVLWIGLMVASFFIPNSVFDDSGYAWFSRVVSVLFLLLQLIILIDFAYKWNDGWLENADELQQEPGNSDEKMNKWHYLILGCAVLLFAIWIVGVALMFKHYNTCKLDEFFTAFTLILPLLGTACALGTGAPVLPASVIAAYSTYLCWGALNANPDEACAAMQNGVRSQSPAVIVGGIVFAAVSLVWVSLSTADSAKTLELEFQTEQKAKQQRRQLNGSKSSEEPLYDDNDSVVTEAPRAEGGAEAGDVEMNGAGKSGAGIGERDVTVTVAEQKRMQQLDDEEAEKYGGAEAVQARLDEADREKYWIFHFIMMIAAIYLAMLLTDWGSNPDPSITNTTSATSDGAPTEGKTSMWVKTISQWLANLLYIWTLCAPRLFPDRDFD